MNRTSIGSKTEHPPAGATTPGEKTASTSPTRSKRDRCLFDSGEKEQRLALRVSSSRCPFCQVLNMAVCVGRFWNAGCMIQQRLCKQCKGAAVRISHRYLRCCLAKYRVQIRCTTWTWLPNGYVALLYTTEAQADRATRDSPDLVHTYASAFARTDDPGGRDTDVFAYCSGCRRFTVVRDPEASGGRVCCLWRDHSFEDRYWPVSDSAGAALAVQSGLPGAVESKLSHETKDPMPHAWVTGSAMAPCGLADTPLSVQTRAESMSPEGAAAAAAATAARVASVASASLPALEPMSVWTHGPGAEGLLRKRQRSATHRDSQLAAWLSDPPVPDLFATWRHQR